MCLQQSIWPVVIYAPCRELDLQTLQVFKERRTYEKLWSNFFFFFFELLIEQNPFLPQAYNIMAMICLYTRLLPLIGRKMERKKNSDSKYVASKTTLFRVFFNSKQGKHKTFQILYYTSQAAKQSLTTKHKTFQISIVSSV